MSRPGALAALASGLAALADERDAVSTLTELVAACAEAFDGDVGLVVAEDVRVPHPDRLDLLAASSHTAGSLELYQLQVGTGPCIDALAQDADVSVVGETALRARWPALGGPLVRSGYRAAHALPLRWAGRPFGALGLFLPTAHPLTADERTTARGFADIAAVAVVHAADRPDLDALAIRSTAEDRALVDRAKGAVRYLMDLDEGDAFALLARRAHRESAPITAVAREVLDAAAHGRQPTWLDRV